MIGNTPKTCLRCRGSLRAKPVIRRFANVEYGHSACPNCRITFDSNVNEIADTDLTPEEILGLDDEARFRQLFVETSRISDDSGEVYSRFNWENNQKLKRGVAAHVIDVVERYKGAPDSLVDVGCGDGFMSVVVAEHFPGCAVIAIDPSPLVMRLRDHPRITPIRGTLQTAELPSRSVDVVSIIGNWMLHFDPFATVQEAGRVMKDDGLLVLDFKNVRSVARKIASLALQVGVGRLGWRRYLERNFVNMRYGMHRKWARSQLEAMGFEIVDSYSKPPRLLEFKNKSPYRAGLKGLVWRVLNTADKIRDEQAWVQMVLRKNVGKSP